MVGSNFYLTLFYIVVLQLSGCNVDAGAQTVLSSSGSPNDSLVEDNLENQMMDSYAKEGGLIAMVQGLTAGNEMLQNATLQQRGLVELFQRFSEYSANISTRGFCPQGMSMVCCNDTAQVFNDITDLHYAKQIVDASSKLPSGILQGKKNWLGSYEGCIQAVSPVNNITKRQIKGRYCMTATQIGKTSEYLSTALCVPHSCSDVDLNVWLATFHGLIDQPQKTIAACEKPVPYTPGTKVALAVCGIVALLVVIGTVIDIAVTYKSNQKQEDNRTSNRDADIIEAGSTTERETSQKASNQDQQPNQCSTDWRTGRLYQGIIAFSLVTNTRKLMSTSNSTGQLTSVNGIRVLSMFWIVLGHTFMYASKSVGAENLAKAGVLTQRVTFFVILNGNYAVDSFFVISGLLVTYVYFRNIRKNNGKVNWFLFYFHRYWRLTPVYAFCIMFYGSLFFHTLHGAVRVWQDSTMIQEWLNRCPQYWWANLLYINNFYPHYGNLGKQCFGWSWYLANDMQFYMVSPAILILLCRYRKVGYGVCGGVIGASIFIRAMIVYGFGMRMPDMEITKDKDNAYGQNTPLYNKMYARIAPYIVGMLLGYLLHKTDCKVTLSKAKVVLGWSLSTVIGLILVYDRFKTSLGVSMVYIAFCRFAWSLVVAWVIFACTTGYGGLVDSILSWVLWVPLGRLTYCTYLIHQMVLEFFFFQPVTFSITDTNMICYFLGLLVLSYSGAYILSMSVEVPMLHMEKLYILPLLTHTTQKIKLSKIPLLKRFSGTTTEKRNLE
ncbi:nose resistant to fluoxetine protein 6-like [Argopecten irradians]|uniref:nose resistant to fluoxetine protein 6-like n=1 Tax=Argopecten irradians TaxID=31199 RepID=UPI0037128B2A